jgi:hypothetical protein
MTLKDNWIEAETNKITQRLQQEWNNIFIDAQARALRDIIQHGLVNSYDRGYNYGFADSWEESLSKEYLERED